jgi:beta-1,4-mannosyl-glycoprotein beta-1,4-N-acetylglucosaminyltransferase
MRRDFYQRNHIMKGLNESSDNDIILISDIDEIPKMSSFDVRSIKNDLIFFKQKMFYYKFNLCSKIINWFGTRACKKKELLSPQWLRNIKSKSYPWWRIDVYFSKNKYTNLKIIEDGGWHFSYLNSPKEIEKKLKNYAHYREYELDPLGVEKIKERIFNKTSVYNLSKDMRQSKFISGQKLEKVNLSVLPDYISDNKDKYKDWLD